MKWLPLALLPAIAHADDRLLSKETFAVTEGGDYQLDAGLVAGLPAALPSGITTGAGVGLTRRCGCLFSYGARLSWSTVEESDQTWIVDHSDYRLRVTGAIRHDAGRGSIALRLGAGATLVHEVRERQQSSRIGDPMDERAVRLLPALDVEAVLALRIAGPWSAIVAGGPSFDYDRALRGGWIGELSIGWTP